MITSKNIERTQKIVDKFYLNHGSCCAGCDWWRFFNSVVGECTKSSPVSGDDRAGMIGFESLSMKVKAGHVLTRRDHLCGDFIDTFEWTPNTLK